MGGGGLYNLHTSESRRKIGTACWLLNASSDVSGDIMSLMFNTVVIRRISVNKFPIS